VLIATSEKALLTLIDKLGTVSLEHGLEISTKKTKVLVASTKATTAQIACD